MPFEVTSDDIATLSDGDLRILVGRLCEAEVRARGQVPVGITYGGNQNAPDGGIDVRANVPVVAAGGFIAKPLTGFQVKAEDMPRASITAEMRPGGTLRPSIVTLAKGGGAYIIVSSRGSVADAPLRDRLSAMQEAVAGDIAAAAMHLDFYDRTRIATWVNGHPAEVAWVRERIGKPLTGWRPFADWSSSPEQIDAAYLLDGAIRLAASGATNSDSLRAEDGIQTLRSILRAPRGVVRLVGLSGVGKTRLVQALFDPTLGTGALDQTAAIYTDVGYGPNPQPLDIIPRLEASARPHIVIVDNCGSDLHGKLAKRVRESAAPISLITVEYDLREDEPEGTNVFRLEPASPDVIEQVLRRHHPKLTGAETSAIASFAEGNARIALAIAATARDGGSLANLSDRELFRRLFHQGQEESPDLLRAAKVLALVYSFDGETFDRPDADLPLLAALAGMTPEDLHRHVAELVRRQLVQRRSHWRAFLPHALAHRLAKEALQDIPPQRLKVGLLDQADARLLKSFTRRLGCLHDSQEARDIVDGWLSKGGLLARVGALDHLGVVVLENVAPVSPEGVLAAIRRAASDGTDAFAIDDDRSQRIVRILRAIAYDPAHFDEAVSLIAALAAGRGKSNNVADAQNVFASVFHAYLSGTHAPAAQRADLLRRMARGDIAGDAELVISGLEAMLECVHFTAFLPFEFGSRRRNYGLEPTGIAVEDWFRVAFSLARDLDAEPTLRVAVRRSIAERFVALALRTGAIEELAALARTFAARDGWVEGWTRAKAAERAVRKSDREADAEVLRSLAEDLRPTSLSQMVKAYVLDDNTALLDGEDDLHDDGAIGRAMARLDEVRVALARDLAADEAALEEVSPLLLTCPHQGAGALGRELGKEVQDPRAVWRRIVSELVSLGRDASVGGFAPSFLRGVADRDPAVAEECLDAVIGTEALHHVLVYLQVGAGLAGRAMERLIKAVELPSVPTWTFGTLALGGATEAVDSSQLRRLLLAVADRNGGIEQAHRVMAMRLYGATQGGREVGLDDQETGVQIMDRVTFQAGDRGHNHDYKKLIAGCFVSGKDDATARRICMRIREAIDSHTADRGAVAEVIAAFGRSFSRVVLDVFVGGADEPDDLKSWVRDGHSSREGILDQVTAEVMIAWGLEDPNARFERLARVVRPWVRKTSIDATSISDDSAPLEWSPVALKLVREAPDPVPVLAAYQSRLRPSSWSGSLATILAQRVQLLDILLDDTDPRISSWAAAAKAAVVAEAAWWREREEAEVRSRDQRFEW
jgi:hypothetical protein